ncbi:chromosomal replication initiator DnaA [Tabrizicola sp.]|uniref:chromosomal replication initiator DnaA n=1 Tax=Tabrizicola sp. TaxID=2005166 RepID=UPI001A40EB7A|nr:chromosomal replication initiator DnaA [Tabrizicola sp.]MBL9063328.1 chromosomal replication initiator DnaA [Tabrizicola sp.]
MSRQLAFDLPSAEAMTREHFFVAPSNALALQAVEDWRNWPGRKLLVVGPDGAGKTHLAHVWAALADAVILSAEALAAADIASLSGRAVVVEDADRIGAAEAQLFHLHNLVTTTGALLLTARTPPRDWGLHLPDLVSRMQATPIAHLDAPDDALLSAVLVKLFADRQVAVPANLIPYLVSRMPRSIGAARALVAALDARALALGRPITRALAGEILGED